MLNKKLILDKRFLIENTNNPDVTPRDFELTIFSILDEVTVYDHKFGFGTTFPYRLNLFADPILKKINRQVTFTDTDSLEKLIKSNASKIILNGYFQKETYFNNYAHEIHKAFVFKKELTGVNVSIKNDILNSNSVSLHVRRGDYVTSEKTGIYHGVCSLEYYTSAIQTLTKLYNDLHFFVFSDDIEWCKTHLNIPGEVFFVSNNNGPNSYLDMELMSLCNHNIIANSSFSWWGAWLNNSKNKVVIAPKKWFADSSINTDNLYPKNWLVI
jgi:hypothetical protein